MVGQYAEESRRGSQAFFFLNDSSGQLQCTCTLDGNDVMMRLFEQLQHTKSYLSVVGKVRPGNTMFVYYALLVTDFSQLIYHAIECVYDDLMAKIANKQWQAATQPMQLPNQLPTHRIYPDKQVSALMDVTLLTAFYLPFAVSAADTCQLCSVPGSALDVPGSSCAPHVCSSSTVQLLHCSLQAANHPPRK